MATTRTYLDYLDEKIDISPANSQEELDAATARSVTAAATAARLAGARGEASPLGHVRQSRRNTQ